MYYKAPIKSRASRVFIIIHIYIYIYRMAGNFGGKIFWRIAENMSFGGIYFGG